MIELRGNGSLAHRLQPLGVGVISASDAAQAIERLGAREPLITLIDTPAAGPSSKAADVKALAADLRALGRRGAHGPAGHDQRRRRGRGRRRARAAEPQPRRAHPHR